MGCASFKQKQSAGLQTSWSQKSSQLFFAQPGRWQSQQASEHFGSSKRSEALFNSSWQWFAGCKHAQITIEQLWAAKQISHALILNPWDFQKCWKWDWCGLICAQQALSPAGSLIRNQTPFFFDGLKVSSRNSLGIDRPTMRSSVPYNNVKDHMQRKHVCEAFPKETSKPGLKTKAWRSFARCNAKMRGTSLPSDEHSLLNNIQTSWHKPLGWLSSIWRQKACWQNSVCFCGTQMHIKVLRVTYIVLSGLSLASWMKTCKEHCWGNLSGANLRSLVYIQDINVTELAKS